MADVMPHFCTGQGCEALHGGGGRESDEVRIAKINADRDIEVARLARAEARQEIEAETEQTQIIADAAVEQAVVQAEVIEDLAEPEPANESEPVVVEIPAAEPEPEPEAAAAPPEVSHDQEKAKKSPGYWDNYR